MADAPVTPKTIYVIYMWLRDDQNTTANCRVTRCFPSFIGSPPIQHTNDEGKKHWTWAAVKDGIAFEFVSDDAIRPDYRVEQCCRATDVKPGYLRECIFGIMSRLDQIVADRNRLDQVAYLEWREQNKATWDGLLQRMNGAQRTKLVLTYQLMRREADELPAESLWTDSEIPVPVRTLPR